MLGGQRSLDLPLRKSQPLSRYNQKEGTVTENLSSSYAAVLVVFVSNTSTSPGNVS
jgi:hypothetical protein